LDIPLPNDLERDAAAFAARPAAAAAAAVATLATALLALVLIVLLAARLETFLVAIYIYIKYKKL
jgi:hypothetical protein